MAALRLTSKRLLSSKLHVRNTPTSFGLLLRAQPSCNSSSTSNLPPDVQAELKVGPTCPLRRSLITYG